MAENGYIGRQPNDSSAVIARQQYVPTANQSEFVFSAGYDTGYVDVYLNGVRLAEGRDFSAGDGNTVYIVEPLRAQDLLEVVAYKSFNPTAVQNYSNIQNGAIGIQSGGTLIGITTTINFIGTGNTVTVNGDVIDVAIEGGGGGGAGGALGEPLSDDSSNPAFKIYKQKRVLLIDQNTEIPPIGDDYAGMAYIAEQDIQVSSGSTIHIGAGTTLYVNILDLPGFRDPFI